MQFVGAAEKLLSSISPELFASSHSTDIVFLLGPSPMRALEVYSMTCSTSHSASENDENDSQQDPGSYTATASRTVLRKLILSTAAGTEGPASKGNTMLTCHPMMKIVDRPPYWNLSADLLIAQAWT